MKNTVKIISLLFLVISIAIGMTSCHGKRTLPVFQIPEEFDTDRAYSITFWAKNDNNKYQQQIYRDTVADFEKIYPNIKVTLRMFSDYNEIYKNVVTNIQTATTPNVCITYPDHIATYNTGNKVIVSLDEIMNDTKYGFGGSEIKFDTPKKEEIIPTFLNEGIIDGSCYAIPFMRSTEACYINRDLVEKLGYTIPDELTWDFIWEVSEAAMEKNPDGTYKVNGQSVMIPFIYKSTDNMMIQMLEQKDAEYSTDQGEILAFNDTAKEILFEVAEYAESRAFATFKIVSYPGNYLNVGQCIFAIDSTAGATWMGSAAPNLDISNDSLIDFNLEVMPIPQYDTEEPKMISQGPSICVFNKSDPQVVLASWIFTQYLLTNDVQIAYSQTEGYVPVTSKAQNSAEYLEYLSNEDKGRTEYLEFLEYTEGLGELSAADKEQLSELRNIANTYYGPKIQASKILLENIDNTFITSVFNGSASLRNAAGQMIENVTNSVRRGDTVDDDYINKLFDDVTALYRLDQLETGDVSKEDNSYGVGGELGPLPRGSVILISCLCLIWIVLVGCFIVTRIKIHKNHK